MGKFKFELDSSGVIQLLKSEEMASILNSYGSRAASKAGDGYSCAEIMSSDRVKVFVNADTDAAVQDNLDNNTLLKAIGGGS